MAASSPRSPKRSPVQAAVEGVLETQRHSGRPLAVIVAGHNGSGKSTMWSEHLVETLRIPLVNADRMMLSVLPDPGAAGLPEWARALRDKDASWMKVAQKGVEAFVAQAMGAQVPFAMETVFSHWRILPNGEVESKIDLIRQMQAAGYFVVLVFVGLSSAALSLGRVQSRVASGGHAVEPARVLERFPRTQQAIRTARTVADAAVFVDNSRGQDEAFTLARVQVGATETYDIRAKGPAHPKIAQWLNVVCPRG